ncbi:hypothetical protein Rsub_01617 [Raphidocelis subcapitata]|uniref:Uncharacterized protein n=1 Tax=Raphidocelis subcapitata TaxID=307507 RepID=A0A2V0NMH7_9CHLO|nr:hypothetical protein Rsub_01617 [Raphidocelis subcapitata]|eukprot:GBF88718.1 hypothetical protein Rsub_01617 [Raphidocelis subcapitata]
MAPLPASRAAASTSRLGSAAARPVPAPASRPAARPLPSRPGALAVPMLDAQWARDAAADARPTLLEQLVVAFFRAGDDHSRTSIDDAIPAEYRSDAPQAQRAWVHSHIATRLATAGDDAFADH